MIRKILTLLICGSILCADETQPPGEVEIHFTDVPMFEFVRFVGRICGSNFLFDTEALRYNISFSTGKPMAGESVVNALVQMLRMRGFLVKKENDYFIIHKGEEEKEGRVPLEPLIASIEEVPPVNPFEEFTFFVHKLKYHAGSEIEEALKRVATDLKPERDAPQRLVQAIQSLQWVKATNSLLGSTDAQTQVSLKKLIESLDVPLRQVFIEVLVIETDVRKGAEFGLQWAAGGRYRKRWGFGTGNFMPDQGRGAGSEFAKAMKGVDGVHTPEGPGGLGQIPLVGGFDFGVIGDLIMHRGKSYLSLGSLVSALQEDADSTIVLNQKLITQDSKNSKIFVGDNIPFAGSVVQTIGSGQQTTANVEYRDIGVNLSITPMLGEGEIITLNLDEEITEVVDHIQTPSNGGVNGIRTTKTNMATNVHVPDKHFLVLSGMVRNAKSFEKAGIPCLGGLPLVGAAFSKTRRGDERRNVIIFVRPQIIHTFEEYDQLTKEEKGIFTSQAPSEEGIEEAMKLLPR